MRAIVAVCSDWGIGNNGALLVNNKEDMRHFVRCTKGCTVLMGRNTLDSFPGGRALKERRNIVLTRQSDFCRKDVERAASVEEALKLVSNEQPDKVWVIGGSSVYHQLLAYCSEVVVTKNNCLRPADAFFPNLDEDPSWRMSDIKEGGNTSEGIPFSFVRYTRI